MDDMTTEGNARPEPIIMQRLQDEIAALKAEKQTLRSTTQLPSSRTDPGNEQAFDFLGLPRELRDVIYERCVVVVEDRVARPNRIHAYDMRYDHRKTAKADLQLFITNKQVRCESLEIYLSKNCFVIPAAYLSRGYYHFSYFVPNLRDVDCQKYLRSISISLDCREVDETVFGNYEQSIVYHLGLDPEHETISVLHRHNNIANAILDHFVSVLGFMLAVPLRACSFQINLGNASCASQCHRLVVMLFQESEIEEVLTLVGKRCGIEALDFLGTINNEERRTIRAVCPEPLRGRITFHGHYDTIEEEWDPDVEVLDGMSSEQGSHSESS